MGFWFKNRKWASSCVLGLLGPSLTRNVYYDFFDKNKLLAFFIVKFDWWLRVMRNIEWFSHGLREIALKSRREYMDSWRIDVLGELGRWSLCSDLVVRVLGRYVATELCACLVAAYRSSLACPWSDCHTRARPWPVRIRVRCLGTIGIWFNRD